MYFKVCAIEGEPKDWKKHQLLEAIEAQVQFNMTEIKGVNSNQERECLWRQCRRCSPHGRNHFQLYFCVFLAFPSP